MSGRRAEILDWRASSAAATVLVSLVGFLSFAWPFLARSESALARGNSWPWLFPLLLALLGALLLVELTRGGLDAKVVATLGVLAAMGGALRVLSAGTAGIEPVFFLVVLGGRVLGRTAGYLLGALAVLTGAFLTGGVGPWTPFQMMATGWVGLGSALLPQVRGRGERWLLAAYGLLAGLAYGLVMNLWFWPFLGSSAPSGADFDPDASLSTQLAHYGVFYALTSLGWDLPRGVVTAVLVLVAARPVLLSLRRAVRRAAFTDQRTPTPAGSRAPQDSGGGGLQ